MSVPDGRRAREVADAVLYEGYLLYPYRASAREEPAALAVRGARPAAGSPPTAEHSASAPSACSNGGRRACSHLRLRFLHVSAAVRRARRRRRFRPVHELRRRASGPTSGRGDRREVEAVLPVAPADRRRSAPSWCASRRRRTTPIRDAGGRRDAGPVVPSTSRCDAVLRVAAERRPGPTTCSSCASAWRTARTACRPARRASEALRHSLIAAHTAARRRPPAAFLSLPDPPEWARAAAAELHNEHTWPVLVGSRGARDVMLSSPIILYDHPHRAREPGDLFDATEIDEILTLRTLTLTDEEKRGGAGDRPAGGRDHRPGRRDAAGDAGTPARRDPLRAAAVGGRAPAPDPDPADRRALVGPRRRHLGRSRRPTACSSAGVAVAKGSRVRLRPGPARRRPGHVPRRPDRHGRGGAARRRRRAPPRGHPRRRPGAPTCTVAHGRFRYFAPDEVEPLAAGSRERRGSWSPVSATSSSATTASGSRSRAGSPGATCPPASRSPTSASAASTWPTSCSTATTRSILVDTVPAGEPARHALRARTTPGDGRRRPSVRCARHDARSRADAGRERSAASAGRVLSSAASPRTSRRDGAERAGGRGRRRRRRPGRRPGRRPARRSPPRAVRTTGRADDEDDEARSCSPVATIVAAGGGGRTGLPVDP